MHHATTHSTTAALPHLALLLWSRSTAMSQVVQPGCAEEGPTISKRQQQRLLVFTSHDASLGATEQRLACWQPQAKPATEHRVSCPSEALAEAADQLLGYSQRTSPSAKAWLGNLLPPEPVCSAGPRIATAPCTQANQSAATSSPAVPVRPLPHGESGLFTQLLQRDAALDDHGKAPLVSKNNSAWGLPGADPQPDHCQQTQQQQVSLSPTVSRQHQELLPQSPAEGLKAMFFCRPAVSSKTSMKHYLPLTHRSDKRYKSRRAKAKPADATCIQQAFPRRQWQTLDDVLQDLDINDITFVGTPMIQDQRVPAVAGPSTPACLPEQHEDIHLLADLQLSQQENQLASPAQPTHTPPSPYPATGLGGQWPPLNMPWQPAAQPQQHHQHQQHKQQQQQHHYTPSVSQMTPQHEQAAVSALPLLLGDLAATGHDGRHMAASAQQRLPSMITPTVICPQLPHHATLLQLPQHVSHFNGRSSHNGNIPEDPQNPQSPSHCVALACDRLCSGTDAQPITSVQSRERCRQIQQSLSAGDIPSPSSDQPPAYNPAAYKAPNSWYFVSQHGPLPAISGLYPAAVQSASTLPDMTAALARGGAAEKTPLQTPCLQWQQPESHLQEPTLQQGVDQAAYPNAIQLPHPAANPAANPAVNSAANSAANPAAAQHVLHDNTSAQLRANSLQPQSPSPSPAVQTAKQRGGLCSAIPVQEASLNGSLDALGTGSIEHELVDGGAAWADPGASGDKAPCTPSTSTRSRSDPDSPAMIAQLPLCSPERMSAASSVLYSSPVLLWNSPTSSAASLPIAQQGGQDGHLAASLSRPVQQQNSQHQHQHQQGQQQLDPNRVKHTAIQGSFQHGRNSPLAAKHTHLENVDKGSHFIASSHRSSKKLVPSAWATAQLGDEQGSLQALEEIVLRARHVLKSLEPACNAAQLHPAFPCDTVMPFLILICL